MKIKRFVAKDIRTALINIKEALGDDAVIMSNKKIPEGVELMAAVDYNQSQPKKVNKKVVDLNPNPPTQKGGSMADMAQQNQLDANIASPANGSVAPADSLSALLNRDVQASQTVEEHNEPSQMNTQLTDVIEVNDEESIEIQLKNFTERLRNSTPEGVIEAPKPANTQSGVNNTIGSTSKPDEKLGRVDTTTTAEHNLELNNESQQFSQLKAEMASIRALLEHQMSGLMWQNLAQKDPHRAMLNDRLLDLGLTDIVADQVSGYVQEKENKEVAWSQALSLLSEQLNTTKNDIINRGGVVSLVGPSGVGKTTTVAKLAARFSQIHGKDEVVLISTDTYRIAGFDQLSLYADMIGCPVELAKDSIELDILLEQYASKKLILIDTAGMSQRDLRLTKHLSTLVSSEKVKIRNYLVLSATSQHQVMQENVEHFKKIPLSACIYTKLDESVSIGEMLSISIQNGLPIAYLTDGQKVPEDIKVANTDKLVQLADDMATKSSYNCAIYKNNRSKTSSQLTSTTTA